MSGRLIVCGDLPERYEAERLLAERRPDLHVDSCLHPWELTERTLTGGYDVALLLKGPIAAHERKLEAIAGLRRNGFGGKILVAGSFLTEKQDAVRAGADYAFDPEKQAAENVVGAALLRPAVAADHTYLRSLFVGEWAALAGFADTLPAAAPDLLLAATSCHPEGAFWGALARMVRENRTMRCVLVEDDGGEEARTEALATGIQPYLELAREGVGELLAVVRRLLREIWLGRVTAA